MWDLIAGMGFHMNLLYINLAGDNHHGYSISKLIEHNTEMTNNIKEILSEGGASMALEDKDMLEVVEEEVIETEEVEIAEEETIEPVVVEALPVAEVAPTTEPVIYGGASPAVSNDLNLNEQPHQIYGGADPMENTQTIPPVAAQPAPEAVPAPAAAPCPARR